MKETLKKKHVFFPIGLGLCIFLLTILFAFFYTKHSSFNNLPRVSSSSLHETYIPKSLTLDQIFSDNHTFVEKLPSDHIGILTVTGDIIPARSVNAGVMRKNNPLWPYEKVSPILKSLKSDITFVNLETPLIPNCPVTEEGMVFCGDQKNVDGLKSINVSVANLANNHAGNYQAIGVEATVKLLKENGILVAGINGPVYKNIKGVTFAFLGYNDITKPQPGIVNTDESTIKKDIQEAKKHADVVVVQYHWGVEYRDQPDERQIYLGRFTIDNGADLVIGNHPHWIQPIEFYKGKLITYAHGNFVFDQMWSQKTREGVVGRYVFYDKTLIDVEYLPLQIDDYGQPHFVESEQKKQILADMKNNSIMLKEHTK